MKKQIPKSVEYARWEFPGWDFFGGIHQRGSCLIFRVEVFLKPKETINFSAFFC